MNGTVRGNAVGLQVLEAPQPLWTIMHSLGSKLDRTGQRDAPAHLLMAGLIN